MRLLALETSEYESSLAVWEDGALQAETTFASRMNLCETLTRRLAELLGTPQVTAQDLQALAVSLGPGSFTGLRVGVATAKALAQVTGVPLVGVGTAEVIAAGCEAPPGTLLAVVQKARQGHVYVSVWEMTATGPQAQGELQVAALDELALTLPPGIALLTGPEAAAAAAAWPPDRPCPGCRPSLPQARVVARLAAGRLTQADPEAALNLQPIYVLTSQAERLQGRDTSSEAATVSSLQTPVSRLRLRPAVLADLPAIMLIENASFSSPWPERSMRDEITRQRDSLFLVAERDGEVVGYLGTWLYAGEAHICTVAVAPHCRRQGLAEIMLLELIRRAIARQIDYMILEYRITNLPAAGLYEKLGFAYIHTRKRYYADTNEDAQVAAIADLLTDERQATLATLREQWLTRYPCELQLDE
jgi:tRNA threonylcarbamoyl adenosine modification protein YeaZ/ribosomal-protein-alanine acetyltransferase